MYFEICNFGDCALTFPSLYQRRQQTEADSSGGERQDEMGEPLCAAQMFVSVAESHCHGEEADVEQCGQYIPRILKRVFILW